MSEIPETLQYASGHEWVKLTDKQQIQVGITDFAQDELGDILFVDLPAVGRKLAAGEQCAVVESVKTASDLSSPVAGEVIAINQAVVDEPGLVNQAPYTHWLFSLQPSQPSELDGLMDAAAYQQFIDD